MLTMLLKKCMMWVYTYVYIQGRDFVHVVSGAICTVLHESLSRTFTINQLVVFIKHEQLSTNLEGNWMYKITGSSVKNDWWSDWVALLILIFPAITFSTPPPPPTHTHTRAQDGTPTSKTYEHVASEIGAEEAEEVGVEHLLRWPLVSTVSIIFYSILYIKGL